MSYKKLKNFQTIFNREDFNYISDDSRDGNIEQISKIILYHVSTSDGKEKVYIKILGKFIENLDSFYEWINAKEIPDIKKGYFICREELIRAIKLLNEPDFKRIAISKGSLNRFNKLFLYGLSVLLIGIRIAFMPELVKTTNINKEQLVRYFFDENEGLRKKFLFNKRGKHSFANKILFLNKGELIVTERLLLRLPRNQIRTYNGWMDLGYGDTPVRILIYPHSFGRDRVFFLYKNNDREKPYYQSQLKEHPKNVYFLAT